MAIRRTLAMTPGEIAAAPRLPESIAWMSCHFGETGLRDLPDRLPGNSLLILDDSILPEQIQPEAVLASLLQALEHLHFRSLLLDFQKPEQEILRETARILSEGLPCPVALSQVYGRAAEGPVLLSMPAPHETLSSLAAPWQDRELWLELGSGAEQALVTEEGTLFSPLSGPLPDCPRHHEGLHCHYSLELQEKEIVFTMVRTGRDLLDMEHEAEALGFTETLGLYQELG